MSADKLAFVAQHGPAVIGATRRSDVFASVAMAQMILESSGKDEDGVFRIGRGLAVRKANNYFGIKADARWTGPKVMLPTPRDAQPYSWFRVYPDAEASIRDHVGFLHRNPRYANAGVFAARTPWEQAQALQQAGYAEGANYALALWREIDDNNLQVLDDVPALTLLGVLAGVGFLVAGGLVAHQLGVLDVRNVTHPLRRLLPSF